MKRNLELRARIREIEDKLTQLNEQRNELKDELMRLMTQEQKELREEFAELGAVTNIGEAWKIQR